MNTKAIITFVVLMIAILGGVTTLLWQYGSQVGRPLIGVEGERVHSRGSGPVVVVEFSDLQCPACKAVHTPLQQILTKYQDKVTYVYRHFPLTTIHKNALVAAQAAEAAHLQGKFFEMADKLFATQSEWEGLTNEQAVAKFGEYAASLGLDGKKFETDQGSSQVREAINKDIVEGNKIRISATPTFYVNGVETEFGKLEAEIEKSLSQ